MMNYTGFIQNFGIPSTTKKFDIVMDLILAGFLTLLNKETFVKVVELRFEQDCK